MPDFGKALKEGFEAARKADTARKEINEVFKDLKAQVLEATGGKVTIERRLVSGSSLSSPSILPPGLVPPHPKVRHWVIVAVNPSISPGHLVELAQWAMDKAGYPCTVTWDRQDHICEDKKALTYCLLDLLKDPGVGEKLQNLTKP